MKLVVVATSRCSTEDGELCIVFDELNNDVTLKIRAHVMETRHAQTYDFRVRVGRIIHHSPAPLLFDLTIAPTRHVLYHTCCYYVSCPQVLPLIEAS